MFPAEHTRKLPEGEPRKLTRRYLAVLEHFKTHRLIAKTLRSGVLQLAALWLIPSQCACSSKQQTIHLKYIECYVKMLIDKSEMKFA